MSSIEQLRSSPAARIGSHRLRLLASCSALAVALVWNPAISRADLLLDANSVYSLDGGASTTVDQSYPANASPNIDPSASDGSGNSIFGHVYADPSGSFGSRSSGVNYFSIVGTADYNNSFTATVAGDYTFQFAIDAGQLNVGMSSGATGTESASLSAVITETVNSGPQQTLFNYASNMALSSPDALPTFSETGAVLNPSGAALSDGSGNYGWNEFDSSVDLGVLSAGETITIDYQLVSTAIGTVDATSDSCGSTVVVAEVIGYGGYGGTCGTSLARIGDPASPDLAAFDVNSPSPAAVPEPASAALLGAGLAGLAFMRRRRKGV